ncbi:MAG: DNA polymerase IV [Clostridia bacterium]|nr:DNA polymerase IV [Deltaproteobacteria bacterium]
MGWDRIILHADMDAFYAAVEQLDNPALRGKPILVGHSGGRGVVTTASYEARPYGVGSAMAMAKARRLCPQAIIVPPRFDRYSEVSAKIMEVFGNFSPRVEALSLDEAFLDMTGAGRLFGPPERMARAIKDAVFDALRLRVSVGAAPSKYVAKVASDLGKPDGLLVVPPDQVLTFLHPLPVKRLWGVGPKTYERLRSMGLNTIADVAHANRSDLVRALGSMGDHIAALAAGHDPRLVEPDRDSKSVGAEQTFEDDVVGRRAIEPHLLNAADRVAHRLRKGGMKARGLRVKLKSFDFRTSTRQTTLARPTDSADALCAAAKALLEEFDLEIPVRLAGLAGFDLVSAEAPEQRELFGNAERAKRAQLDQTLDAVWEKFGAGAVKRGDDL